MESRASGPSPAAHRAHSRSASRARRARFAAAAAARRRGVPLLTRVVEPQRAPAAAGTGCAAHEAVLKVLCGAPHARPVKVVRRGEGHRGGRQQRGDRSARRAAAEAAQQRDAQRGAAPLLVALRVCVWERSASVSARLALSKPLSEGSGRWMTCDTRATGGKTGRRTKSAATGVCGGGGGGGEPQGVRSWPPGNRTWRFDATSSSSASDSSSALNRARSGGSKIEGRKAPPLDANGSSHNSRTCRVPPLGASFSQPPSRLPALRPGPAPTGAPAGRSVPS
jgi:hypothetical protein